MRSGASRARERVTSGAMLAFAILVSSERFQNFSLLCDRSKFGLNFVEIVEIHRIDLQHVVDNVAM